MTNFPCPASAPTDAPPRELEVVDYTFEFLMDYGAFREFRRHRMQTYLPQPLTVAHGVRTPSVIADAGLEGLFTDATGRAERAFHKIHDIPCPVPATAFRLLWRNTWSRMPTTDGCCRS